MLNHLLSTIFRFQFSHSLVIGIPRAEKHQRSSKMNMSKESLFLKGSSLVYSHMYSIVFIIKEVPVPVSVMVPLIQNTL